ncbi:MAG: DUF4197 domain-containing protein [Hydrogenophilales bacterium]|nr:DUF4197 domain-containing protein [Hydrogenophilales bacterium]
MKAYFFAFALMLSGATWALNLGDVLKGVGEAKSSKSGAPASSLSDQDVTRGLKDALVEGAGKAVSTLGRTDGFLLNDKVRIPLPESLQNVESVMKALGQGKRVEELKTSLNRAAEAAVPEAKTLLLDAIKNMSVADAKAVLSGGEDAATKYFRQATEAKLHERFLPIVGKTVNRYKLTQQYDRIAGTASQAGLIGKEQANMSEYVTGKALDGLFFMIAEEEKAIRRDPLGRSSEYVRKVFGNLQKR